MPYPNSPFDTSFNTNVITSLKSSVQEEEFQINLEPTLKWLCTSPKFTSYRVNSLKVDRETVAQLIQDELDRALGPGVSKVEHSSLHPDILLVKHKEINSKCFKRHDKEIIVDVDCAAAVLRGAHVYAPGVLAMITGTRLDEPVSLYADLSRNCKKGLAKVYNDEKRVFIGNGVVKMTRRQLFGDGLQPSGVAIEVLETFSGCPPIGDNFLPSGWAMLQNLPSILCVYALNPQKNETILDMCAAPGNKTTHIASLIQNEGLIVAIDKTPGKLNQLKRTCEKFGANVLTFQADSCKIVSNVPNCMIEDGPPFPQESFDRILLDAPCSALGKRPQLANRTTEKVIRSFVPLQRKLFESAVALLKPKGTLVYSTCTITLAENENMVSWALRTFDCLKLVEPASKVGGPGWRGTQLSEEERCKVQRFGYEQEFANVDFFIACFVKT